MLKNGSGGKQDLERAIFLFKRIVLFSNGSIAQNALKHIGKISYPFDLQILGMRLFQNSSLVLQEALDKKSNLKKWILNGFFEYEPSNFSSAFKQSAKQRLIRAAELAYQSVTDEKVVSALEPQNFQDAEVEVLKAWMATKTGIVKWLSKTGQKNRMC